MKSVERDWKVRGLTTHTPQFLGLTTAVWPMGGGHEKAGENIVIGFVDSGISPHHPSFASHHGEPYGPCPKYRGKCEVNPDTKKSFCNGKIVGAQHFAKAAIAAGAFNPAVNFASPLDGNGHGRLDIKCPALPIFFIVLLLMPLQFFFKILKYHQDYFKWRCLNLSCHTSYNLDFLVSYGKPMKKCLKNFKLSCLEGA